MRHEVPQFIDIEDKIFGPLTFKQAIYLAGASGAAFIIFYGLGKVFPDFPAPVRIAIASPFVALGLTLAFVKINKRPFIYYLEAFFYYMINSKRYIWKKEDKKKQDRHRTLSNNTSASIDKVYVPKVSRSKLKDLAWSLDMDTDNN